ncbi:MAG: RluA family pseudouridine synthase [Pontiellaceae bacterium]|nr:RluA family pseudouridine synthase [Pontiellaceae bacterium]
MSSSPNTSASGFCAACGVVHSLGEGDSRKYALELMAQLETTRNIGDGSDPSASTDILFSEARGHMFGVLECADTNGKTVVLKAFSGQYNGEWLVDGWVPPILDAAEFHRLSDPVDREIKRLNRLIAGKKDPELIRKRKTLSQRLMKDIHALCTLTNFRGETRPLSAVFQGGIPTGAGDCCAPKLLNHAAKNGLKPLGLSEFYWGRENRSGTRQHKQFYSACAEKCRPILGFMLCGAEERDNGTVEQWHTEKPNTPPLQYSMPIVHHDDGIVVVNKPSGLLAVPGKGEENQDCVVSRIKALYPDCIEQPAVHRLDMDASGLMVLALTADVHRELSRQFHDRETGKRYIALLDGELEKESGTIELPFRLDVENRPFQIYDPVQGKTGITRWKKLSVENGRTRVEFTPVTGRTHQLRLHAASEHGLGIPILGDRLYGSGTAPGQLKLHAVRLSFIHPRTGERMEFFCEPPF